MQPSAAAAAAEQPAPPPSGIRYTHVDLRLVLHPDGAPAAARRVFRRDLEFWTRSDGTQRTEFSAERWEDAEGHPIPRPPELPAGGPYQGDESRLDFSHVDLEPISTDPVELRRQLEAAGRARWADMDSPGRPPLSEAWLSGYVMMRAVDLLSYVSITPQQRKAAFEVLAGLPGSRAMGERQDAEGRTGQAVELRADPIGSVELHGEPRSFETFEILIDTDTGAMLSLIHRSSSEPYPGHDRLESHWLFKASADVDAVGERP